MSLKNSETKPQSRILYPGNLSLKNEGEIETIYDKQKVREFVASRAALQEMLKEILQPESK